ncbi:MAG: hypothetical protein KAJ05_11240, partial [Candidatus Latescibacteria bacterium]|nr:hypothetical protein [Candidatus Latescibacterota bacterium]
DRIHTLRKDDAGNIWALLGKENTPPGISRFDDTDWTNWGPDSQAFEGGRGVALFPDASGDMVTQLDSGVLVRFKDGRWKCWSSALESETKASRTYSLVDPFGNLWVATQSRIDATLARFDGTHWTTWPAKENLPGSDIWALLCDGQGDMWVGLTPESERVSADSTTYVGGGVGRFDGSEWNFWTQEEGLANYIDALLMDSMGNLWVGARNGIRRYDGTAWQSWTLEDEAIASAQILLQDTYGHIWAGAYNGLSMFDGSGWKRWTMEDGLASNNVNDLLVDASGRLWVGTDNGLSMYAPRTSGIAPAHQESPLPRSLALSPNVPNPFNGTTAIRFEVPVTGRVRLVLYNVLGQRVRTLVDAKHNAGTFAVRWDGK